ncbi:phage tail protein [Xenorhabdus japonica]|uniref:Phage tail fibre repeat-containing protein n=1 Tax=Xenorhabdus japonica TaxID=53341 RepID=A0A1I5D5R7_9GAMM|nr:phage tail protein [Xenorhabdus japonica]SFN94523.1 Phage tail fibre repeat-containing protein [Xenorhabdus japonica]
MSTKYFALLTHTGIEKLKKAASSGTKLEITHMAVGDGGGSLPTPNAKQSSLINERHRAELDALTIAPQKPHQIIAEQIIPEGEGNWWVREMGLFDKDGSLIAVGNCADLYKPEYQEQTIRMALTASDNSLAEWVKELISGLATRRYVRERIKEHAESRNHPDATLKERGFVALSNAVNSDSEAHAATPKAIKTAYELANKAYELATSISSTDKYVPLTRKINGKELVIDVELTALDVGAYSRKETDELIAPAEALAKTAEQLATTAIQDANNKVPLTRKINDKALTADIQLTAADIDAYNKAEIDDRISKVDKLAETANHNATTAIQDANSKVPLTRKVNDKALTADIQLTAADVDTYNKTEIDDHIGKVDKLAETANHNATTAIQDANNKVPLTRKVNDKELTTDIQLTAADVDAYNKEQTDGMLKDIKIQISDVNNLAETANTNAIKAINDANSKVPLTRKVNDKALTADIQLTAADVDTYNKVEIDERIGKVDKLAETANSNADAAIQDANSKVPLTRTVNDKALTADIQLTAADVDTYNKVEIDERIGKVDKLAETANSNADAAIQDANSKVPLTRTVNDKALTADIQLTAADVDTYNKVEIDERIGKVDKLAETANSNADAAIQDANSKVPLTRKVNDKVLTADIQLTAADVDTYNKVEIDERIGKVDKLAETANSNADAAIQDANSKVPLTRKVNDKALTADIQLTAADVDSYNKKETDDLINGVKTQVDSVQQLANIANNNATTAIQDVNSKVPLIRKVNGKELATDIQLTAADIGAYNKEETDGQIKDVRTLAEHADKNANQAIQDANSKVPSIRKVNGKELLTDIELNAADVGTYNKVEIDDHISKVDKLAETANSNANAAIQDANSKVPLTRKVNDKALSVDIQLTAADVDTYNKAEIDDLISKVDKLAETANSNANAAIQDANSRVPSTRKVNGKELVTDIALTANDVDTYDKAHIDILIDEVRDQANAAANIADSKVPLTRTVNGKALLSDIKLTASDMNAYTKGDVDRHIESVNELVNAANNNADSRVPLTRTVNGKALLTNIKLTASDVGTYSKAEVDTHVGKAKKLANDANVNAIVAKTDAENRLEKSKNGADIPDKQAFVRNLGLGDLVGLGIESRRIMDEHTIIKIGEIFMINGLVVASEPIGEFNQSVIGGVAYYTHFYKIKLPTTLPNGIISCQASIVGDAFEHQRPGYLADVKIQRNNSNGIGLSKDTLTISITTPQTGWIPHFYYQVVGY